VSWGTSLAGCVPISAQQTPAPDFHQRRILVPRTNDPTLFRANQYVTLCFT